MLTSGDIVLLDFGVPTGHEAGFPRPAVIVTAATILKRRPSVVQVVPLTSTNRGYDSEIRVAAASGSGLTQDSVAQCQHIRSVSAARLTDPVGAVSPVELRQIRETIALLIDL